MPSLRESLVEMAEASANRALLVGETLEGREALARMTLLLSLIDRLDADDPSWIDCGLLPETVTLLTGNLAPMHEC